MMFELHEYRPMQSKGTAVVMMHCKTDLDPADIERNLKVRACDV